MKNRPIIALASLLLLWSTACEELAFEPQPESTNVQVYEEFWRVFSEKYAMFEAKGVDWQNVYANTRLQVDNTISEDSLFSVLSSMTLSLSDAHTTLINPESGDQAFFDLEVGFPENLDEELISNTYLQGNEKRLGGFIYSMLPGNIGYIIFRDFESVITDEEVDLILTEFEDTKGIILDVRGNTGGDPFGAGKLASHFTNHEVYAGFERFKTGPGSTDFSDSRFTLEPTEGITYTKPVMVLTNRLCYSATTTLLYLMDPMPNVTFVGGRTGGGSGSVADGQLINGWYYSLSVSEFIDARDRHLDDGVDPDILVELDPSIPNRDEIIERAIQELN
ncbi:MAG: S41 family peptidase [Roseivirga sp.]|nr:S41 family peptidase [Roseivirga sp.]